MSAGNAVNDENGWTSSPMWRRWFLWFRCRVMMSWRLRMRIWTQWLSAFKCLTSRSIAHISRTRRLSSFSINPICFMIKSRPFPSSYVSSTFIHWKVTGVLVFFDTFFHRKMASVFGVFQWSFPSKSDWSFWYFSSHFSIGKWLEFLVLFDIFFPSPSDWRFWCFSEVFSIVFVVCKRLWNVYIQRMWGVFWIHRAWRRCRSEFTTYSRSTE